MKAPDPPKPTHVHHHCCHHHHAAPAAPAPATVEGPVVYHVKAAPAAPAPAHFVPYRPADEQQYWCKELDGLFTLKTHAQISATAMPGSW